MGARERNPRSSRCSGSSSPSSGATQEDWKGLERKEHWNPASLAAGSDGAELGAPTVQPSWEEKTTQHQPGLSGCCLQGEVHQGCSGKSRTVTSTGTVGTLIVGQNKDLTVPGCV